MTFPVLNVLRSISRFQPRDIPAGDAQVVPLSQVVRYQCFQLFFFEEDDERQSEHKTGQTRTNCKMRSPQLGLDEVAARKQTSEQPRIPTVKTIGTAKLAPPVSASPAARFWPWLSPGDEQKPKPQMTTALQSPAPGPQALLCCQATEAQDRSAPSFAVPRPGLHHHASMPCGGVCRPRARDTREWHPRPAALQRTKAGRQLRRCSVSFPCPGVP